VDVTQKGKLPRLRPPLRQEQGAAMAIDAATRRNLELVRTLAGERRGSVLAVIDRTVTGPGARLLAVRLSSPLTDPAAIRARLDDVAFFADESRLRDDVRTGLKRCPDLERALTRLSLGRGGPRDLAAVRDGLREAAGLREVLGKPAYAPPPAGIAACTTALGHHATVVDRLDRALAADLPLLSRDGGFIAAGYHDELDEQRALRDESRRHVAALQKKYVDQTGVSSLKVKHNNVLGYFIEVGANHADKMAGDAFIHRQTMANAMRFTTVELGELQDRIGRAADRALALELALFEDLVAEVLTRADEIASAARALAELDVAAGLADLAVARRYVRPVVDDSRLFDVRGGRHPVVEAALETAGETAFQPNDCLLGDDEDGDGQRIWLLTGPNMAGKSTFLRQNALIAVLAQMGSFVPAASARIGVVDKLFSRVGAADDLARGRSTFMVEMVETATILNRAGARSLVILDEIGRGTATFDGLSIAWAAIEHLHAVNGCRALFATHYHELTALAAKLPSLGNHTMRVKEWQGDVVFLHEVAPGAAEASYGIQVAKLAGLPPAVIARATEVLETLEQGEQAGAIATLADDLPLFSAAAPRPKSVAASSAEPSPVDEALADVHPDDLTPRQALEALYRLKALIDTD
jgi:DNA mismatch repair protein MutS